MRNRQLRAAVGQVGHADFFSALLDDVVDTAKWERRQILAVGIARPVLNRAGHAHVALGLRKPRRDFGVVDRPVLAEAVEIRGLEINVSEAGRRTPPEIGLAPGGLASLPVPVRARSIGIGNVVLEQIPAFAVFGLFDGIGLLVGFALKTQRIAVAAILKVVYLPMLAIVLSGSYAGPSSRRRP